MSLSQSIILILISMSVLTFCGGGGGDIQKIIVELNGDSIMYGPTLALRPGARLALILPNLEVQDKSVIGLSMSYLYDGYIVPWVGGPISPLGPQLKFSKIQRTAKIVVIELGGNDAYGDLSPIIFEQQLVDTLQLLKNEGRIPVVTGIVQVTPGAGAFDQATVDRCIELNEITHKVATSLHVDDSHWDTVEYNGPSDTIDGLHRTQVA